MSRIVIIVLSSFFALNISDLSGQEKNDFILPLDIPIILSGTYAELRTNHFHSGIDIKTQGKPGFPIHAIYDGYIYRIKITPGGYGNTLYLMHPNGYTSVYGHLDRFVNDIEQYVKSIQYNNRTYPLNTFPNKEKFPVKKGEIIGYSGNSGYSFGPHLHFEIRESKTETPINPLLFYHVDDTIPPIIKSAIIYSQSNETFINGSKQNHFITTNGKSNIDDTINVSGPFSVGVEVFDRLNGASNKCGIYTASLQVDDSEVFSVKLDHISFSKSRYINSYIDYAEKIRNKRKVQKLYIDPNNQLDIYNSDASNGIISLKDEFVHKISIEFSDAHSNRSLLEFHVKNKPTEKVYNSKNRDDCTVEMAYNQVNEFEKSDLRLYFPMNSFYDNICFNYAKVFQSNINYHSPVYFIHDRFTPVHKKFTISIKPDSLPDNLYTKTVIARLDEEENDTGELDYEAFDSEMNNGFVTAYANKLGKFVVMIDTLKPEIIPFNFIIEEGISFTGKSSIKLKMIDELSGINTYNGYIDNQWVLFEYDLKYDLLIHHFDSEKIEFGKDHTLKLIVTDKKNNTNITEFSFYK